MPSGKKKYRRPDGSTYEQYGGPKSAQDVLVKEPEAKPEAKPKGKPKGEAKTTPMDETRTQRRPREQIGAHKARQGVSTRAAIQTEKQRKKARLQEGYSVYEAATGKKVGTGISAADRQSRADYAAWMKTDAGKKAWAGRSRTSRAGVEQAGRTAGEAAEALKRKKKEDE
jgi:hypothetical protein